MGGGMAGNFGDTKGKKLDLDAISNYLAAASLIPGVDTFADLAAIPVDLARGDFMSAGLDAFGMIPFIGEIADTAKMARKVDNAIDGAKALKKVKTGKTIVNAANKHSALDGIGKLPSKIQKNVKSFFKRSSNNYNNYSVLKNKNNTYTLRMENPGKVPGSKAVYNKIIDKEGRTIKVYKDTFDPQGNLVHRKDK